MHTHTHTHTHTHSRNKINSSNKPIPGNILKKPSELQKYCQRSVGYWWLLFLNCCVRFSVHCTPFRILTAEGQKTEQIKTHNQTEVNFNIMTAVEHNVRRNEASSYWQSVMYTHIYTHTHTHTHTHTQRKSKDRSTIHMDNEAFPDTFLKRKNRKQKNPQKLCLFPFQV